MSRATRQKAAVTRRRENDDYAPLLDALRKLKAQGCDGFEGLFRDLLQHISGRTLRLVKSGPQGGKDVASDSDLAQPGIAIEAKRFSDKTNLPLDELKSKIRDTLDTMPEIDIWGVVASREIKEPDWSELKRIGEDRGVTLLCLDWRNAQGALPVLAALCAAGRHITEKRLSATLNPVIDRIEQHPEFDSTIDNIRRQLTAAEVGFDLARDAARHWLGEAVSSTSNARRDLQSHADLGAAEAHCISRPAIETALSQWWNSGPGTPAVLLGDEGRGKTWTALSWCLCQPAGTSGPMILATSAKDIRSTDAGEILAGLLSRCMPHVPKTQLAARLKRWLTGSPKILLVIDGLNEAWGTRWGEVVRSFEVEPWKNRVGLLLTSRSTFWREDLLRLPNVTKQPIQEISVSAFSDPELIQFLAHHGLTKDQLPGGLLELIKIPRFAKLAISMMDRLRDTGDITVARIVLEDWRERMAQRGADLRVDDEGLIDFVSQLGQECLADKDFQISQAEIHRRLSEDSGLAIDDYRSTINELIEGHWLKSGDRPHTYIVSKHLLPFAIGLDLARSVEKLTDESAVEEVIAKYEEQLRGDDMGVAILRAATSVSFSRQKATPPARFTLLRTWLRSQNFFAADFAELWPLISRDPNLFLDFAEDYWRKNPVGRREGEILPKAFANAAKWPNVLEALASRLPGWAGAYGLDPIHWHYGKIPPDEGRKKRTEASLAEWLSVQGQYHAQISDYFRVDADDYLPQAAFSIMSFLPRAPFIKTLVTRAIILAITHDDSGADLLEWLLRLNPHDHDALETGLLEEVVILRKLSVPATSRAADILLEALATPRAMETRGSKSADNENRQLLDNSPEAGDDNVITWRNPDGSFAPVVWADRLARFSSLPDAKLSAADLKKLQSIADGIGADASADDFSAALGRPISAFARWTPSALGQAIRRIYFSTPGRDFAAAARLAHQFAGVSLVLGEHERDHLFQQGFDKLKMSSPEDAQQKQRMGFCFQSMIVAGLIGRPAADQIAALKKLAPNFTFGTDLAGLLTPPTTEDVEGVFDLLHVETDENAISGWLGYLNNVKLPLMPSNAGILLSLVKHANEHLRGAAAELIAATQDTTLGTAFVDSGWAHSKGQATKEALSGSYLIARYGDHLAFNVARSRIAPQVLALLVELRGMREDEVRALFEYAIHLLDDKVSERKVEQYVFYPQSFNAKEAWRKIVLLDGGAIIKKIREVALAGKFIGFLDVFPLVEVSEAILELYPGEGAEIWTLVKQGHERAAFSMGEYNNLPFCAPDDEKVIKLRTAIISLARNDDDFMQIVFSSLKAGHEQWLIGFIREAIIARNAGKIASGLTLAGLLDTTESAGNLWCVEIEPMVLKGWLGGVRDEARRKY